MSYKQGKKFTPKTQMAKKILKRVRLIAGLSVQEGADLLSISRKQMEDVETLRNYGCYLSWDFMIRAAQVYKVGISYFSSEVNLVAR